MMIFFNMIIACCQKGGIEKVMYNERCHKQWQVKVGVNLRPEMWGRNKQVGYVHALNQMLFISCSVIHQYNIQKAWKKDATKWHWISLFLLLTEKLESTCVTLDFILVFILKFLCLLDSFFNVHLITLLGDQEYSGFCHTWGS